VEKVYGVNLEDEMTVKELIERLSVFNPSEIVCVDGYEGGVTDKFSVELIKIKPNMHTEWYYGEHENNKDGSENRILLGR